MVGVKGGLGTSLVTAEFALILLGTNIVEDREFNSGGLIRLGIKSDQVKF